MSETATLAGFTAATTYDDVPESVVEHAKTHVRDTVGVALAGGEVAAGRIAVDYVNGLGGDGAAVFGRGTASPEGAAFANGVLAHAMEWDDTPGAPHHLSHPSAPTFPAAVAAGERADASGREVLAGYVVGVEVLSRLERASFPDHYFHGWHDTGTYGVFGAVAAAASILGLDERAIRHAFGVAASCSAGLRTNNGTMTKPFHAGHAAADGLRAAVLADAGLTADPAIFEGPIGYGAVYSPGDYDPSSVETLGGEWDLLEYGYKPFPAITHNHGAQLALLRLVEREDLDPGDVEGIDVTLHERAEDVLWVTEPADPYEAICSIEFNLATILRERGHGVDQYSTAYVTDPATRAVMERVDRQFGFDDPGYDQFAARVAVETADGRRLVEEAHHSPLDVGADRLDAKFRACAGRVFDEAGVDRLDDAVRNLDSAGGLAAFLDAVGAPDGVGGAD